MKTLIFVYGTLKRGQPMHRLLHNQRFCGTYQSEPGYSILNLGAYPGLIEDPHSKDTIHGEVYEVDQPCLATLDEYEGVNEHLFERRTIKLKGWNNEVQAYFYTGSEFNP